MPSSADIQEALQWGARDSPVRTGDQTAAAIFWCTSSLFVWSDVARSCVQQSGLGARERCQALILSGEATAEALRVASRLQRTTHSPRPGEVIRGEAAIIRGRRIRDPQWTPLLGTSQGPDFPCADCLVGGAVAGLLRSLTGCDACRVSISVPFLAGLTRCFESLSLMLQESEDARVWGGVRFRSSVVESTEAGLRLGEAIAGRGRHMA